jgi:hypothetical protein
VNEISHISETLKIELERCRANLGGECAPVTTKPFLMSQPNSGMIIQDEEALRNIIFEKVSDMRSLVTMASEIFFMTNPKSKKAKPKSIDGNRAIQDNRMLRETIYTYEKQLTALDQILNSEDSKDAVIFELKKLGDS